MAKLEELFLKKERTRNEDEQLRNYIRTLESLLRGPSTPKQEVYSKSEINQLLGDIRKLITPASTAKPTFLTVPLTNTSFDGDAFSTTAATLLPLGSTFGVPSGCKGVLVRLEARDSVAWGTAGNYLSVGPSATYYYSLVCHVGGGDVKNSVTAWVPCDANGDIYYRIVASGAGLLDAWIEVWGYYR